MQDINDNENPKWGLILNNKDITIPQWNMLRVQAKDGPMTNAHHNKELGSAGRTSPGPKAGEPQLLDEVPGVMSSANPHASPGVSALHVSFLPQLAGPQPECLHLGCLHLGCLHPVCLHPEYLHPGRICGACVRISTVALDIHLLGAVLKWELISSWKWQVKISYAYCKGLKTNACTNCNPVRFSEPRSKSSHTTMCAPFGVSIVFPRLRKMLTTCDILSNSKRNWNLQLLRRRYMEMMAFKLRNKMWQKVETKVGSCGISTAIFTHSLQHFKELKSLGNYLSNTRCHAGALYCIPGWIIGLQQHCLGCRARLSVLFSFGAFQF